jgi:pyrroline-5-carboxylate reductase
MKKILFYGAGNMGQAVLKGLLASGYSQGNIKISGNGPHSSQFILDKYGVESVPRKESFQWADVIILGIKPQIFAESADELKSYSTQARTGQIVVSLMAGVNTLSLSQVFESQEVVRTMPNLPIDIGRGTTSVCVDGLSEQALKDVCNIFNTAGTTVNIPERLMDTATALAGSLPAFVFQFAEGLIAGGVREGMPRLQAEQLVLTTLAGSAELLLQSKKSPSDLTTAVCSPGGTTIAGVYTLEEEGVKAALMKTISATTQRSRELGA